MSFCTKCGRPRAGDTRFCTGCGAEFPESTIAPPPPPPPVAAPPGRDFEVPRSGPRRSGSRAGGRTAFLAAAVVILLAAGGGAYALVSSGHNGPGNAGNASNAADQRSTSPTAAKSSPNAASTSSTSTASAQQTGNATATASPSQSAGTVAVAPAVASNPAVAEVETLLNSYFQAINTRNYAEFSSLLDAALQANESASSFDSGYATTTDSAETLTAISSSGGDVAATVTFTSHQNPADSVDGSSCNDWTVTLYLAPDGGGYVITAPPSGYEASYTDC
jgi:hypothetical protein